MLRSQHRVYDDSGEVARTQDVWGAEGISGRVKFLPLAWAGMPKTSFRKNSDSPRKKSLKKNGVYLNVLTSSSGLKLKPDDLLFLKKLMEVEKLRSEIDRTYTLEQIVEAHRYVDKGHKKGNVVITVEHKDKT